MIFIKRIYYSGGRLNWLNLSRKSDEYDLVDMKMTRVTLLRNFLSFQAMLNLSGEKCLFYTVATFFAGSIALISKCSYFFSKLNGCHSFETIYMAPFTVTFINVFTGHYTILIRYIMFLFEKIFNNICLIFVLFKSFI